MRATLYLLYNMHMCMDMCMCMHMCMDMCMCMHMHMSCARACDR